MASLVPTRRRAFDVPARKAGAPGTLPFHLPMFAGRGEFPEREVGNAFLLAKLDPLARFQSRLVEAGEETIVRLQAGVEVDSVRCPIGKSVFLDVDDKLDLVLNMIGRAGKHRWHFHVQARHVVDERVGIDLGDFPRRLAGPARALFHLVFAGVGIRCQVSDIGDIHDVAHRVAIPLQHPLQQILEKKRAEVADVLIVVHRRSAGVETGGAGDERLESAPLACVVVVQHQRCWHCHFQKKSRQCGLAALT